MKQYDSPIFGNVPKPSSFGELLRLIQRPLKGEKRIVRIWRGQGDIAWPLHSSAYRRLALDGSPPSEKDMLWYEESLLKRATHRGFRYINGRRLSDFDLLARLQHHGAATRLVDATRNALVGLYFSVVTHPKKVGALIGIHSDFLGGYEGEPQENDYQSVVQNLDKYQHPQTWEPPQVSPRVAAQHSQFLYSAVSSDKTGSLSIHRSPGAFLVIAISPRLKRETLTILSEVFDIRYVTLFPDLDGFGFANSYRFGQWDVHRW